MDNSQCGFGKSYWGRNAKFGVVNCLLCIVFLFVGYGVSIGQTFVIQGKVTDSLTGEPLPFVNISINGGNERVGTTTNIDGRYWVKSSKSIVSVEFSHIAHRKQVITDIKKVINVALSPKNLELKETIISADDKGIEIIDNVILNSDKNNYEKNCSFSYMGYDKFIVDIDTITRYSSLDTLMRDNLFEKDTTFHSILDTMYFFITESLFERKHLFSPSRDNTEVIASRVAGMKDPFLQMIINQVPVSNIYVSHISIIGSNYLTPFTKENAKRFFFNLDDVLQVEGGNDSVFVVSFRPRQNTTFDGISGVVYVNSRSFAIDRVIFQPYIRHESKGGKLITPHIDLAYKMVDSIMMPISIDCKMIVNFASMPSGEKIVIRGVRSIFDIKINPLLRSDQFSRDDLDITSPLSKAENEAMFKKYRIDPLSEKEMATYRIIDSLVKANKFDLDKFISFAYTASSGVIPISFVNIDLSNIIGINKLEGWMLGMGLSTNDKLLKWMSLSGFVNYGFKNKKIRWGAGVDFNLSKYYETKLTAAYSYRPIVAGSPYFVWNGANVFNANTWREYLYLANKFEYASTSVLAIQSSPFKNFGFKVQFRWQNIESVYDYFYGESPPSKLSKYQTINTDLSLILRYKYGEKSMRLSQGRVNLSSHYPEILFGYTHYFKKLFGGSHEFNKIELSVTGQHHLGTLGRYGELSYQFNCGYIDSPVSFTNMFSQYFSYNSGGLYTSYTFSVMRENEFVSDLYSNIFILYDTPVLFKIWGISKPKIGIALNAGWGKMVNGDVSMHHFNLDFPGTMNYRIKEMNHGYYETGLMLNNIIDVKLVHLGFATHYRFGAYSLPKLGNNFSYKLTLFISL